MARYTANGGFVLMGLLGYTQYAVPEKDPGFQQRWKENYQHRKGEPILLVWDYVNNPFHRHSDSAADWRANQFIESLSKINPKHWTRELPLEKLVEIIRTEANERTEKSFNRLREESKKYEKAFDALARLD